jgi:hypothetical protein
MKVKRVYIGKMQVTPTQVPVADADRMAVSTASPTTSIVDGLLGEVVQGSLTKDSGPGQTAKPTVGRNLNAALAQERTVASLCHLQLELILTSQCYSRKLLEAARMRRV